MVKALGKKDPEFTYKVSCPNCAEELEYFLNETFYCLKPNSWSYVICPVCNYKVEV